MARIHARVRPVSVGESLTIPRLLRGQQPHIPADERLAKKHPEQGAQRQVGTERQFRRPDALPNDQGHKPDHGSDKRSREDAEENGAPAEKSPDRSQELQIATPHGFARNLKLAHDAVDLVNGIENELLSLHGNSIVVKLERDFAEIAVID